MIVKLLIQKALGMVDRNRGCVLKSPRELLKNINAPFGDYSSGKVRAVIWAPIADWQRQNENIQVWLLPVPSGRAQYRLEPCGWILVSHHFPHVTVDVHRYPEGICKNHNLYVGPHFIWKTQRTWFALYLAMKGSLIKAYVRTTALDIPP